jgi:alkylhydroperoxidase family enzyme
MAYIRYVPPEEGGPELKALYEKFHDSDWDCVDGILKIHSHDPTSWETSYAYYSHLMRGPSPLTRAQREMIAVVVSSLNRCLY